jgi:hypothetical protein
LRSSALSTDEPDGPRADRRDAAAQLFDESANVLVVINRYEKCVTLAMLTVDEKGLPGKSSCPKGKPIVEASAKAGKALFDKLTTLAK